MSQDMERGEKSTPSPAIGLKMERTGGSGKWEVQKSELSGPFPCRALIPALWAWMGLKENT